MSPDQRRRIPAWAEPAAELTTRGIATAHDISAEIRRRRVEIRSRFRLAHAGGRDRPILIGPWFSEVGFEVLYWLPVLNRLLEQDRIDPARATVISRGGARAWYADLATDYVELFDLFTPEELKEWHHRRVAEHGGQKHMGMTALDEEILARADGRIDPEALIIHPSLMYNAFRYFWSWRTSPNRLAKNVSFRPLPDPGSDPQLDAALPGEYAAIKAYFSDSFPATDENRAFLRDLIERVADQMPVVLLSTGLEIDDHEEFAMAGAGRVIDARDWMTPHDNLTVQSRIIKRASVLLTNYGGFSYLGPFLGVPSVCFYSNTKFNATHLVFMRGALPSLECRRFVSLHTGDFPLLADVLGSATRLREAG